MKILIIAVSILLLLIILVLIASCKLQEKMIFFPEKLPPDYQFAFNEKFEELNFQTEENISINSLLFKSDSSKGLILYFHGNAGSLNSWGQVATDFLPYNFDVLFVDYRGFGKSTGLISKEAQLHNDAEFIYNEMIKKYNKGNIIIYGRSIGTGIASKLAESHVARMLILETPFYSLTDLVKKFYPFLPASLILKYKFDNYECLQQLKFPVFLIHGTMDEVVPYNSSTRLAALSTNIKLYTINGGTHNNLSDFPEFHNVLKEVIR